MGQTTFPFPDMGDCVADHLHGGKSFAGRIDRVEVAHPESEITAKVIS
jgi:hypothetical protein